MEERHKCSSPSGLDRLANRQLMRALSLGYEDVLIPLLSLQPPLPARSCHCCLLSHSLASRCAARELARRRGQKQFATGLKTGSVGPTINYRASAFCRSNKNHSFACPTGRNRKFLYLYSSGKPKRNTNPEISIVHYTECDVTSTTEQGGTGL